MEQLQLPELITKFKDQKRLSYGKIARNSREISEHGIEELPRTTVHGWVRDNRHTLELYQVVLLARCMDLSAEEADQLLQASDHPALARLLQSEQEASLSRLLSHWNFMGQLFQAPRVPRWFVGRQEIISRARASLRYGYRRNRRHRLCFIHGEGGVGKTVLAMRLAQELRVEFPDGVLWAEVQGPDSLLSILRSFATSFDQSLENVGTLAQCSERVRSILQAKNCLVILDNIASTQELELLLPSEGRCATLVTLRDRDIASAFEGDLLSLAPFDIRESMTLLVEMLGLARIQAEEAASNRLINFAAGLPLILRLIGGTILSTDTLSLAKYAGLLQDKLVELPDWEVLADQERKVRATFEVSFQRLLPDLQLLFASLGLFQARHFSVAAVAYLNQMSPPEATVYLSRLTRAALIQPLGSLAEDGDTATSGRYQIHTLLQLFAFAKLGDVSTPLSDWRARLHDYYTQFVSGQSGAAIDVEWINVAGLLQTALAGEDKGRLAALIQPLTEAEVSNIGYMDSRGQYALALSCLTALLTDEETLDQATLHYKCGVFARRLARHERVPDFLKRSLELMAPFAATQVLALQQAAVYEQLGRHYQQRDVEEAMDHVMTGLELLTTDESETANLQRNALLNVQAAVMFHSGVDRQAAIRVAENALASLGEAQNLVRLNLLINLGILFAQVSDVTRAYEHIQAGLVIALALGNKRKTAALLSNKGALERRQGLISQALQTIEEARQLFADLADHDRVGTSLNNLAMLHYQLEQDETAEACLAEALDLAEVHGLDELKLFVLTTWSKIHIRAGAFDKAAAQLAECDRLLPVNAGGTSFYLLPYINLHKGRLAYRRGQMDDAIRHLELAIGEGRTQDRETVGLAQATYAELLVDLKQLESVRSRYEEAITILVDHDIYEQALAQLSYANYLRNHESVNSAEEIAELMAAAEKTLAKFQAEP